jgi:penicillin G amidase
MRRILVRILAALLFVVAVAAGAVYFYLRQSLPSSSGEIAVAGISGPIDIVRDRDAIPHIFAATKPDALYGLGYVHAQDRLWQMEFQRRIGHGRLSEIFGDATITQDRFLRTVGFGRAAESAWQHLPDDARQQIDAYCAGVNAFISTHHGRLLPPEFTLLRFEPEPFTGADVLVWVKMMAWDLSGNYSSELMRHDIAARVGNDRMADLLPSYPPNGLNIVGGPTTEGAGGAASDVVRTFRSAVTGVGRPFQGRLNAGLKGPRYDSQRGDRASVGGKGLHYDTQPWSAALAQGIAGNAVVRDLLLGGTTEALGSNNWVVDGTLTASGKPLLANDPHLGTHIPSLWYLAHMSAGDFDVIGATLPGAPAVAIGRNKFIAWGETNVAADVEDLFMERIDPSGTTAEFRGVQEPIRVIPETIIIKGGTPIHLDVRVTRHGPLVSDALNAGIAASKTEPKPQPFEPLAFRWTALDEDDATIVAFLRLNEAHNWNDFTAALRHFVVPAQNFVYADVDGHIGYYAPGRIPQRANGDGSRPAEGWTGESEWTGWIPFDELPHTFDPPEHFIVTANNRPMPADDPHLIGLEYPEPYRAQRITELVTKKKQLTPNDFRDMQADTVSLHAQALLPLLLRHVTTEDARSRQALEVLGQWNFTSSEDSAAAAIFQAWFRHLVPAIVGDELGPLVRPSYEGRFSYITRFVTNVLTAGSSPWCDDVNTPATETCDQAVTNALQDGLADLRERMGGDMARWRWDAIHHAVFPHQGLDAVSVLRPILSRSVPNGGDWSTIDVGPVAAASPYDQISIPGYRQIVDLSPANDSRFLDAVGEAGHFLSPHYDDFLGDWRAVRHRKMRMTRSDVDSGAVGTLRLTPR